jgi:hypothetical protein
MELEFRHFYLGYCCHWVICFESLQFYFCLSLYEWPTGPRTQLVGRKINSFTPVRRGGPLLSPWTVFILNDPSRLPNPWVIRNYSTANLFPFVSCYSLISSASMVFNLKYAETFHVIFTSRKRYILLRDKHWVIGARFRFVAGNSDIRILDLQVRNTLLMDKTYNHIILLCSNILVAYFLYDIILNILFWTQLV